MQLATGVDGTLRANEIGLEPVEDVRHHLKVGDELTAKIVNVDQRGRTISLSVKARLQQDEREAHAEYQRKQEEESSRSETVGDLVKTQLEEGSA